MLKVYTDIDLLNEGNRSWVFPLLFELVYTDQSNLSDFYQINDNLIESDIALWPLEYGFSKAHLNKRLQHFLVQARKAKKRIWIYTGGDYGYSFREKDIFTFRLGGLKSRLTDQDIILPSFIGDPYEHVLKHDFEVLNKDIEPKIGFVGHATGGFFKYFKELLHFIEINIMRLLKKTFADYQPFYPSSIKRLSFLKDLSNNDIIKTEFILRKNYRAGVKTEEEWQKTTIEFYKNIFDCSYTFCMRGNGNFSVRFYEALAVGRIPFFLDTDCKLPLSEFVDWNDHIVRVASADRKKLDNKLLEFHNNISEKEFEDIQLNNRKLWNDYLTREGFFKHIHDKFVN